MPTEPPPTAWQFPPAESADEHGLVGIGADLEPATLLSAYRRGLFPMPISGRRPIGWWSPDPRGILPLDGLKVSRSLRRSARRYEVRVDRPSTRSSPRAPTPGATAAGSPATSAPPTDASTGLGWAHSVEAWDRETGELAGGLYGVKIDGLFAGESMFHRRRDASKVALVGLVERLRAIGAVLLDVQWLTPHLESLGAVEVPRERYLDLLEVAMRTPTGPFPDA